LAARARHDRAALEELLRILEPSVVQAVRLVVGSGSRVAEEAAQDALLDIWHAIGSLRHPEAVEVWACRIAMRRARRANRWERVRMQVPLRREDRSGLTCEGGSDDFLPELKRAFDGLPQGMRETAVLRLFVGLSEAETAEALGCSTGTVKSNLHDARRRLAASLQARGIAPAIKRSEAQT
jgi:RNA polymerase sigma factor (sigma-70 family)